MNNIKTTLIAAIALAGLSFNVQAPAAQESTYDGYLTAKQTVDTCLENARQNRLEYEQRQQSQLLREQNAELRKLNGREQDRNRDRR